MRRRIELHVDRLTVHAARELGGEALAAALDEALRAAFTSAAPREDVAGASHRRIEVRAGADARSVADAVAGALARLTHGEGYGRDGERPVAADATAVTRSADHD